MEDENVKTNRYSVFMIKAECQGVEDILLAHNDAIDVPGVGQFFFDPSHPRPPSWMKNFFNGSLEVNSRIVTSSAKGLLLVPITSGEGVVYFVVCFGYGRFLLKEGVIEERFGLKTVLNSLDSASLRSIDKVTLGSVPKQSHEQMSRDVQAADFGIDIEQDLISSVTGKSRDRILGTLITGRDALTGSAKVDISNVVDFLTYCLARYRSEDYKQNFNWIDQIAELRNKKLIEELNDKLVWRLNNNELAKTWMAVPEVINWADIAGFRYSRRKQAQLHDDLEVPTFLHELAQPVTLEILRQVNVYMISASSDQDVSSWPVYRCMYSEMEIDGEVFILNNGKWYRIAKDFTEQIQRDFEKMPESAVALPDCSVIDEGQYNELAARALSNACCMDRKVVPHGGGHSTVEFCDVFTGEGQLLHIKRYGGSSVLSHLFAQGVVSGELFLSDADFRQKLNGKLPAGFTLADPSIRPIAQEHEIIFGIISESDGPLDIPFFSKVSLKNACRRLSTYGYKVSLKKIQKTTPVAPTSPSVEAVAVTVG